VGVLPPNKRDEVCSVFVDVVDRETNAAQCRLLMLQRVKANKMITGLYTATESFLAVMDPILRRRLGTKP